MPRGVARSVPSGSPVIRGADGMIVYAAPPLVSPLGDAAQTILSGTVLAYPTALSLPRIWTLPPAIKHPPGFVLTLGDLASVVTVINTLTIVAGTGDTLTGATAMGVALASRQFMTDGISKWHQVGGLL